MYTSTEHTFIYPVPSLVVCIFILLLKKISTALGFIHLWIDWKRFNFHRRLIFIPEKQKSLVI